MAYRWSLSGFIFAGGSNTPLLAVGLLIDNQKLFYVYDICLINEN